LKSSAGDAAETPKEKPLPVEDGEEPLVATVEEADPSEPSIDDLTEDEETAATAPKIVELDDDAEIEVKVDGKAHTVKFKELRDNYSGEKAIQARLQKASETQKAAEARAAELYQTQQAQLQRLTALDNVLKTVAAPQQVDWAALKAQDPLQYALKREEFRDWQDKQAQVQAEIARVNAEQAKLQADANSKYLDDQAAQLVAKLPAMADPSKAADLMGKLTKVAKEYGYSEADVASVMDHRAYLVLNDALKYRELVAKKKATQSKVEQPKATVKVMKVGAARTAPSQAKQQQDAILNKARQTGSPEDVAMTLLMAKKPAQARR
jgi:hypothetical protein